jgi:hypothetical protein
MSHKSDVGRKIATNMSEPMKAKLKLFADRKGMTLAEYVRKVLFDHIEDKLGPARPVKTGSAMYTDEAPN